MLKKDSKLSLCNMDFEEPDLVELIQSDLRSEMNKILSESEVEEIEAVASKSYEVNQTQSPFDPNTSRNSAHHNFRTQMGVKRESDEGDVDQPQMVRGEFDVIGSTSLQEMNQHDQMHDVPQEISGHFSVGSYPPDFHSEIGQYPSQVTEHGDLQSLTWLTTVDVQVIRSQALQKLTEHGTVITSSIVDASQANQPAVVTASGDPAEHQSVIQVTPTSNMQVMSEETNGTQQTDASLHQTAHTSRYMPIQPHLSPESGRFMAQPNRYHLQPHPGGGPMGRNSFDGTHMGSRRYLPMGHHHPYPPPQYTPGRGAYVHGGALMHRYHHHPQQQQKVYPKPVYSYSCLIAMALYNSKTGCLPVSEIYNFMMENYPYFKTAPDGWKNSVRHNLSLNKCFEKVEKPNGSQRKGCLWALNPAKIAKMKEEVQKWKRKDPDSIRRSMSNPEELDRELEEMRRSDEEAARRRMVSLTAHGLTTSALHPHHPMHQPRHPPGLLPMHHHTPHMATGVSGPGSHPGTPQRCSGLHFSTELAQQNFALTLARSASHPLPGRTNLYPLSIHDASSSQVSAASVIVDSNNNNNAAATCSEIQSDMIVLTPGGGKSAFFASPHSSSSSNNTSLLGTLTDCTTGLGEELDASLAELAGLHESFWDGSLDAQPGTSSDVGEHFTEGDTKSILPTEVGENSPMVSSDGHIRLPPVIRMLSSSQSGTASPDTPDFKTPTGQMVDNFGRDLAHFASNNIKPVVML